MLRLQNGEMSFEGLSVAKVLGSAVAQQIDFLQELDCELGAPGCIGDAKRHTQTGTHQTHGDPARREKETINSNRNNKHTLTHTNRHTPTHTH